MGGSARMMRWSCAAVAVAALAALAGKLLNVPLLASAVSSSIPMAPSSACAFLLFAAALHPDLPWSRSRRVRLGLLIPTFFLAVPAVAIFAARYLEGGGTAVAASRPFDPWMNLWTMSPLTAGLFFVVGASSVAFVRRAPGRASAAAAWGTAFAAASALVILIGYLYRLPLFYGGLVIPMAATTAACFLALSAALLVELGRGRWPWRLFEGDSPRGLMMRSFLPIGTGSIFVLGFLDSRIELSGTPLLSAFIMLTTMLGMAWLVARISARVAAAIESAERRAGATEARYRTLFESMINGFAHCRMLYDGDRPRDFVYLSVNKAFETLTGLKDVEGRKVSEVIPGFGQSSPELLEIYGRVARSGAAERAELRVQSLDQWFDITAYSPCRDEFIAIFDVITARKRLEAEREQFFKFFQTSADLMCLADPRGAFLKTNPSFTETLGYSETELISKPFVQFVVSEDRRATIDKMARQQKKGSSLNFENRFLCKDGSVKWLSWRAIYSEKDGITYATARDITERKREQDALRESEGRFRALIEGAPEAVFVQEGGNFVYLNPAALRLFAAARAEDLLGREILTRIAPEYHDAVRERIRRQDLTGRAAPLLEMEYLRLDGARLAVETTALPIRYQGRDAHVVFVRDIRERKRSEAEGFRMQKLESLGVLAGGIAHDFNNMLTGILGSLELLKGGVPAESERLTITQEAMSACLSAKGLAKQLLTFASGGTPVIAVVDLAALVSEASAFAARGTSVNCAVSADGECFAKVDKDQIAQVVQNLVINAIQAMPSGGTVSLDLARDGDFIRLRVKDTGTGISAEQLAHIFDPYFSTKGAGRGLGLSMCHSIVTKHGGRIGVDSRPGEGTTFTVRLPAADPSERRAETAARPLRTGSGRVLIMDDEKSVVAVLGRLLLKLGYDSEAAADGEAALALYRSARQSGKAFDAVIMDLTIAGGMGGKETVQRMLELDPRARVIVSSGYSADPVVAEHEKHGFCGTLIKPYRLEDVSATMTQALPPAD